jgi:hypothetical protein
MALTVAGCAITKRDAVAPLRVPYLSTSIEVDGDLVEECYREHAPLTAFVVAGDTSHEAPSTKAWLFWNEEGLVCSFECVDSTPAWVAPTANERDVDGQDRVELFLRAGDPGNPYFCIEAASAGAIHDYQARFYRKFDDAWFPTGGWTHKTLLTPYGYTVEMVLPKSAIEAIGLRLETGFHFKSGLFRADYDKFNGQPTWITWVDHGGEPDFHVAESFGTAAFTRASKKR